MQARALPPGPSKPWFTEIVCCYLPWGLGSGLQSSCLGRQGCPTRSDCSPMTAHLTGLKVTEGQQENVLCGMSCNPCPGKLRDTQGSD